MYHIKTVLNEGVPCLKGCGVNYRFELKQATRRIFFFFLKIMIMGLLVRILWASGRGSSPTLGERRIK